MSLTFMLPPMLLIGNLFYDSLHELFIPASALIIGGDFNCYDNANNKFGCNAMFLPAANVVL